jgi:hypothetical protein
MIVELLLSNINYLKENLIVNNTKVQVIKHLYQIIKKVEK